MESYVKSTVQADRIIIEFFFIPVAIHCRRHCFTQLVTQINAANKERPNVILLKSAGDRTFCAGASFDELMSIKDEKEGLLFFPALPTVINAIRKSNKIVPTRCRAKQ